MVGFRTLASKMANSSCILPGQPVKLTSLYPFQGKADIWILERFLLGFVLGFMLGLGLGLGLAAGRTPSHYLLPF